MSDLTLPVRASLRHIKNEAKQLHKALLAGDGEAASMIRIGLPRLGETAAVDDVTLMEVQHVLSREYGYRDWNDPAAVAEFKFNDISQLSDKDTEALLRQLDQRDLVIALRGAGEPITERLLGGMSLRVRTFDVQWHF